MPHSNYNRSSYNSKPDPIKNEKWNANDLCKHLSTTFPLPFPRCNRARADGGPWPGTPQRALTTTRPGLSNLAQNPTLWPRSNTSAKALAAWPSSLSPTGATAQTVSLENLTSPKSHLNACCKLDTGWSTQLSAASGCSSVTLRLRSSFPQTAHPHLGTWAYAHPHTPALGTNATTLLKKSPEMQAGVQIPFKTSFKTRSLYQHWKHRYQSLF